MTALTETRHRQARKGPMDMNRDRFELDLTLEEVIADLNYGAGQSASNSLSAGENVSVFGVAFTSQAAHNASVGNALGMRRLGSADTLDRHTETRQALERPKLDVKPMSWSKVVQIALDGEQAAIHEVVSGCADGHRIPSEGAALGRGSRAPQTRPPSTRHQTPNARHQAARGI